MKMLSSRHSTESPVFERTPAGAPAADAIRGLDRFARMLARFGFGLLIVLASLILVRLAVAAYLHSRLAGAAGDISTVAGLDERVAGWLQGMVSWSFAFASVNVAWRAIGRALCPIPLGPWRWRSTVAMLLISGFGAVVPSVIMAIRGVDIQNRPVRMEEIGAPTERPWFAPDGQALITFSREPEGRLRFWNRDGLTPDRGLPAQPVTGGVRAEWEKAEATRVAAGRAAEEARRAVAAREQEQREAEGKKAAARAAAQREAEAVKREAARQLRQAEEENAETARQLATLRGELQALRSARERQSEPIRTAPEATVRTALAIQPGLLRGEPLDSAPAPATPPPRQFVLRPNLTLVVNTRGEPCEVRADVDFMIYPNHPSLPHALVPAGKVFRFPRCNGVGPTTIHARPIGPMGTLWVRPVE